MNGQVETKNVDVSQVLRKRDDETDRALEECLAVRDLNLYYGDKQALKGINLSIPRKRVTAFIGPSGCGKSTRQVDALAVFQSYERSGGWLRN